MVFEKNLIYHIFNQGNNRQQVFYKQENYLFFLKKMREFMLPHLDFLCYCLMPNHFHFLVYLNEIEVALPNGKLRNLNDSIAIMLRSYTRAINIQENRSGSLFREGTKAKNGIVDGLITLHGKNSDLFFRPDNDYACFCFNYIHNNPPEAGLVRKPEDWPFSSASDYAGLRQGTLCNQNLAKKLLLF